MSVAPKPTRREPAPSGQHFLLSKAARSLPLARVFRMSEASAYQAFRRARWPESNGVVPWCPRCGCEGAYELAARVKRTFSNRFRCKQKECRHDFSVTSGTIFQNRKLPFRTMLQAVALSVQSVKGNTNP